MRTDGVRKRTTWTLGGPSIALLIAACLLATPLVFAFAWPAEPHGAPARTKSRRINKRKGENVKKKQK